MLTKILKECHESCTHQNGALKKITIEDIKRINDICIEKCNYCPFEKCNSKICSGTEEIIFLKMCYECNKCKKWSSPWD